MKHVLLFCILLFLGSCTLNPKPLTFSSPESPQLGESIVKNPYMQIVFPALLQEKTLSSRSYFTGIANVLNVELGKSVSDILHRQASHYFTQVEIVDDTARTTKRLPRIEVIALNGEIGSTDLSITGEIVIEAFDDAGKSRRSTVAFAGEGSISVMLLGPLVANDTLTKAEHAAMQDVINKLTLLLREVHTESRISALPGDNMPKQKRMPHKEFSRQGRFFALVIGNTRYRHLPRLITAGRDAMSTAQILKDGYGFKVTILLDATRADILKSLSSYRKKLTANDNLLIYYAGHGWLDKEADEGYWLPVDAEKDDPVNWISNTSITTAIRAMVARHVLVIADSCYSGKLTRGLDIRRRSPSFVEKMYTKKARMVLSSGGLEPVMDSGGKDNHSVFAAAFLAILKGNKGYIDSLTIFQEIRKRVAWNAEQVPEYGIIHNAGHDGGEFIFFRQP